METPLHRTQRSHDAMELSASRPARSDRGESGGRSVSGRRAQAFRRSGLFLAGTTEADAGVVGSVFGSIAAEVFFLGAPVNGMRTKLIVNSVAHVVYVMLMEAGALAAAQDIPLPTLHRLLARESGLMRPLTHRFGERLRDHDFAGGMSTVNARKDSSLIFDTARQLGVPLFVTSAAHSVYEMAMREGLESLDYASIGMLWKKWLGGSLGKGLPPSG